MHKILLQKVCYRSLGVHKIRTQKLTSLQIPSKALQMFSFTILWSEQFTPFRIQLPNLGFAFRSPSRSYRSSVKWLVRFLQTVFPGTIVTPQAYDTPTRDELF